MIERINPSTMWDSKDNGHSQISVAPAGRLAFLSGQIATPADGGAGPDDLIEQARGAVASLGSALEALAAGPRDIVMLRLYVVDGTRERFEAVWPVVLEFLDGAAPSATVLGVTGLAAPELQLEIEIVVAVP